MRIDGDALRGEAEPPGGAVLVSDFVIMDAVGGQRLRDSHEGYDRVTPRLTRQTLGKRAWGLINNLFRCDYASL